MCPASSDGSGRSLRAARGRQELQPPVLFTSVPLRIEHACVLVSLPRSLPHPCAPRLFRKEAVSRQPSTVRYSASPCGIVCYTKEPPPRVGAGPPHVLTAACHSTNVRMSCCKQDASLKSLPRKGLATESDVSLPPFSLAGRNHGEAGPREGFVWAWELLGWSRRRSTEASPAFGSSCHHRKFTEQRTGRARC